MVALSLLYLHLIIYRERTKASRAGKEQTSEQNRKRETGRRMPPPSSPVPRLSSVPSDVFTVHTIASRSPHRPLVSALREREGRPPRPVQGDAIATTSPPHRQRTAATGHRLDVLPSCPPRPRPLPSCGEVGHSKRNRKRGN